MYCILYRIMYNTLYEIKTLSKLSKETIMARPGLTKEDVFTAADTLKTQGTSVTIQNIRNLLGTGSPNTIHRHLANWKGENIATKKTSIDISETLKKALLSEIQHINAKEVSDIEQRLKDAELDNLSLSDESAELAEELATITGDRDNREAQNIKDEEKTSALRAEITSGKQAIEIMNKEKVEFGKVQQKLETALAAAKELKEDAIKLQAKNSELSNQVAEARTEIAVTDTKLSAADSALTDVNKRLDEVATDANKRIEIATSKLSDAEAEVKSLNSELTKTMVALSDAKGLAVGLQKDVKAKDVEIDKLEKRCDGLSKKIEVQKKSETKK